MTANRNQASRGLFPFSERLLKNTFLQEVGKPLITQLLGNLGVMFLFSSLMSMVLAIIFGKGRAKK